MYIDDLMRKIEVEYDHAYFGAYDDNMVLQVVGVWMDTTASDPAWQEYKDDIPAPMTIAEDFQDEIQVWLLDEWEAYLKETGQ